MKLKAEICNSFNRAAQAYEESAQIQNEIGDRLFSRLSLLKMQPQYILDLGCGSGLFSKKLKDLYPKAQIVAIDLAYAMLECAKSKQGWLKKWGIVNADMHYLPFVDGQFDLIFSNQVIHWTDDMQGLLLEIHRVMAKNACLMFTTLGPDTFKELRVAFAEIDSHAHVNEFLDMHDLGDMVFATKFVDPVLDMDMLTAHYTSTTRLLKSIKKQGVKNINSGRKKSLTGKKALADLNLAMQKFTTPDNMLPLTYEVVYGHAWKGETLDKAQPVKSTFSVAELRATLPKK